MAVRVKKARKNPAGVALAEAGGVFVIGTCVTLGTALALVIAGKPKTAAALIVASPFPCPPGMPC